MMKSYQPLTMRRPALLALAVALAPGMGSLPAVHAAELSWSGFATAGYAISDRSYTYERYVDRSGTFMRDSLVGAQLVAELAPRWSATVQATVAPSVSNDQRWDARLQWAFLSYRLGNDTLLRAGKLRMPMYLFSENMQVGASYDVMHLPTEVYSTAPTNDYTGLAFSRNWSLAQGELGLEAYAGRTSLTARAQQGGSSPGELHTRSGGVVLAYRHDDDVWRMGWQRSRIRVDGMGQGGAPGGVQPSGSDIAPGVPVDSSGDGIDTRVALLGADLHFDSGLRIVSEYAWRHAANAVTPKNSQGAYLTLLRPAGKWTPYVTAARLLSEKAARVAEGGRGGIDDQKSLALGTSYSLGANGKLKLEWMHVHVGTSSSLIDHSMGAAVVQHQGLNVLSASYSVVY
ncbi:hypothetical protein [Duganella qianjiadongensis]|uniref:Porin n=1 Tax=Duganella qianjiadongensis TaxID=2692176 RepID=A0ABW9VI48_9BURK|nr:hypothetical protein [Duganella qianjiadongensis]MYM39185.1 hypothetical protein [Duganella qianjiadongensis]